MNQIISDLLRKIGFTDVDLEHDAHAALDRLRHKQYGLVLSDWEMQPMSGDEFLKQMRKTTRSARFPSL